MSVFWLLWYCIYMLIMVILMKIFFSFFSLLRVPMDSPWCGDHGVQVWWLFFFGWKMASGSPLWVVRSQKWCRVGLSAVFRSCAQLLAVCVGLGLVSWQKFRICSAKIDGSGSFWSRILVLAKKSHLFCQNGWLRAPMTSCSCWTTS